MKFLRFSFVIVLMTILNVSCFDDREVLFVDSLVEFEDAVTRARATGQVFPIISVTRATGTPSYQVNLVAKQLSSPEQISFSTDDVPASLLSATTIEAVEGVHYTLSGSAFEFPSGENKASFTGLTILPGFPAQAGVTALLILKLDGNDKISPSENFRRLGIRISLN